MRQFVGVLVLFLLPSCAIYCSEAFLIQHPTVPRLLAGRATASALHVVSKQSTTQQARRKELLSRNGPYFQLERLQGAVEFGSAAKLVTQLEATTPNPEAINEFLSDGGLALSIWDEELMEDLGNSVFRLQTMKLQFLTIQLAPSVDMKMWTQQDPKDGRPVFLLHSVDFDPNIQLFPGVGVSAASLGVEIEVVGQLRPTKDGKGVTGTISFATKGILPPPMRVLPESAMRFASDTINETIVKFAVQSFQKGAILKYKEFRQQPQQSQQQPQ
jgi:hypothetical protein